jgi:predicted extracellular nuclease
VITPRRSAGRVPGRPLTFGLIAALAVALLPAAPVAADSTPQVVPFGQDWSNTALITANDNWSGVPGVLGYLGQDITTSTGTDPQTLLAESSVADDTDVIANQTNTGITNGGVGEFQIADPVVALQGSGTADAPYLLFSLNTSGLSSVTVAYTLRDIDASADNAIQPVALQYRVGASGSFTNVPAGFVADATTGPTLATLVTPVTAVLPGGSDNQPLVQVRVMTANAAGNDEWVGVDDISITANAGDSAPAVQSTTPTAGATGVAASANIGIAFSEVVDVSDPWFTIECTLSGAHTATVSGGPAAYTLDPDTDFTGGETCTVTVTAANVADADVIDPPDSMAADYVFSFTIAAGCGDAYTRIPVIQGVDDTADVTGTVATEGVVVSDDEGPSPTLRGFYLQDPIGDGNPATSDGIFVFNGNNNTVSLGDQVRVTGNASEFQGQTQISASSILACGTGTVDPIDVTFPLASSTALEAYEGMLVRLPQVMYVTEHFQLGRFGQVVLSSGDRLQVPTAVVDPGAPAIALQAANNLNRIILDDSLQSQNPDPIHIARGGLPLSASNTLRGGDTATGIVGVMTYTWAGNAASGNAYRVRPFNALGGSALFEPTNARPGSPVEVDGTTRVAGMNLLNYFNTFDGIPDRVDNCSLGVGGAPADCRGADTQAEFDRQWPKTVAAILGLDADVIGVNEIENDGYGPDSAIAHLVDKLNAATSPGTYAFVDVDAETGQVNAAGTDAIKVGIIYRPTAVTPVGTTAALNTAAFVNGGDGAPRSRPSIAQAFETVDGARFIVDVNHFKSKGSACDLPDQGDGQGNCNAVRTNAADELATWLASDPTGTGDDDILIVGDLNSYAREDPVVALEDAGFANLVAEFIVHPYSYVFDGQWGYLDYALGTASAMTQVAGVVEWHINSDEPSVLDYNTDFKTPGLQASLYAPDQFRVSDHDPIVVGLEAASDRPIVDANGPYQVIEGGTVQLTATGSDPTGDELTYEWDFDGDGFDDGTGATVTFDAAALQAPQTVVVTVRVTDEHGQFSTDTAIVDVIWDFDGFFGPATGRPTVDDAQAGSTIPIKFSLDGDQGLLVLADGYPATASYTCGTEPPDDATTPVEPTALQYDPETGLYTFLWRTEKSWAGSCRTFVLGLADGTKHYVDVRFREETSAAARPN